MVKRLGVVLALAAVLVLLPSCEPESVYVDPSQSGGTGNYEPGCVPNTPCDCPSGERSYTVCDYHTQAICDCAVCANYDPPSDKLNFQACGGAPFGAWALKSHDISHLKGVKGCETVASELSPPNFLLDLRSGGTARLHWSTGRKSYSVRNSCLWGALQISCSDLCTLDDCGICTCEEGDVETDIDDASWTRGDTGLNIQGGYAQDFSFEYCVKGDELSLHDPLSDEVFTLSRVYPYGTSAPCAERAIEQCDTDGELGCHVGVCAGSGCPDADSKERCTIFAGCSWDTSKCGGDRSSACSIADYGKVPGCKISDRTPHCVGTPTPCSAHTTVEDCSAQPDCMPAAGCTGSVAPQQVDYYVDSCGDCLSDCTCSYNFAHGSSECIGTGHCAAQKTDVLCGYLVDCEWREFATCAGTPPSCDARGTDVCSEFAGCSIVTE